MDEDAARRRLDPSVAAVRLAVRRLFAAEPPGRRMLVACSGGQDSMALAAATAFEGVRAGWLVGAVIVDHGLQPDSAHVTGVVEDRLTSLAPFEGLHPVSVVRVTVGTRGGPEG